MISKRLFKPIYPAVLCASLAAVAAVTKDDAADPSGADGNELDVYLVIGQVDASVHAEVPEDADLERCFLLNADDEWEPAKAPLNRHSTIGQGSANLGPAFGFAKAMLEQDEDRSIGLIVNMGEAANVEGWGMKTKNYRESRRRTKIARRSGTLKGVLWYGGGGKSPLLTDLDHWKTLITNIRADQGLLDLPVVLGEVPGSPSIHSQLAAFNRDVHASAVAASHDLVPEGAKGLDAAGVQTFGKRYAERMLELHAARQGVPNAPAIPLIDTHVHAMANKPGGLDAVADWMERNGVEQCIVSPIGQSRAVTPEQKKWRRENFEKYAGRIHRFCMLEPGEVESVDEAVKILEQEMAEGAIGFGEHYGRGLMFDDEKNLLLYEACERVGLPIMFHIDSSKNMVEMGMRRVERVLQKFPDCKIIAHAYWWLQLPDGTCDRMLERYPNLYADVSGLRMAGILNRDRNYTREFLIRHADRILFGSDAGWWSFGKSEQERELQFMLFEHLDLPDEVRRKIYRTNAEKLFDF